MISSHTKSAPSVTGADFIVFGGYLEVLTSAIASTSREITQEEWNQRFNEIYSADEDIAGKLSISRTKNMTWEEQTEDYFSKNGLIKSSDSLCLGRCNVPGVTDSYLYIPTSVITKAMRIPNGSKSAHSLTKENIANLYDSINSAPATIHNPERNAIIFITSDTDSDGRPIIAVFSLNNDLYGEQGHKAVSIYGRENINGFLERLNQNATIFVKNENVLNSLLSGNQILRSLELLANVEHVDKTVAENIQPVNSKYSMSGINARNANMSALSDAKNMLADGASMEEVFQKTGWYVGMDGKWRFEIDDSGMQYYPSGDAAVRANNPDYAEYTSLMSKLLNGNLTSEEYARLRELDPVWKNQNAVSSYNVNEGNAKLGDIIQHDELFDNYPDLKNVNVRFSALSGGEKGNYNPRTNTITLNEELRRAPEKTLIHEIQHAIQRAEGFTKGATPFYWASNAEVSAEDYYQNAINSLAPDQLNKWLRYEDLTFAMDYGDQSRYAEYEEKSDALYNELYDNDWFQKMLDASRYIDNPQAYYNMLYNNTAGEIEARDVANRLTLPTAERRATLPNIGNENTVFAWDSNAGSMDYVGKTADGIEVYETNDDIKSLSFTQKKKKFIDNVKSDFRGRTIKFQINGNSHYAQLDNFTIKKNLYGDKKSTYTGRKAKANISATNDIYNLMENAIYESSKNESGKDMPAHKDVREWHYFYKTIQIDNKVYDLLINIREKSEGEYVYLFTLRENKKISASPVTYTAKSDSALNLTKADNDSMLSSDDGNVNSRVSVPEPMTLTLPTADTGKYSISYVGDPNADASGYVYDGDGYSQPTMTILITYTSAHKIRPERDRGGFHRIRGLS